MTMILGHDRKITEPAPSLYRHPAMALILSLAVILLAGAPSRAEFEAYNLFGAGAVSNSTGGSATGADSDNLDFLTNPALIYLYETTRYTLGFMSYNDTWELRDYKQTVLSYAKANKGYTLVLDDDGGTSRDMLVFTTKMPFGNSNKFNIGVNVAAFRYSTPVQVLPLSTIAADDGSGITFDVGAYRSFNNGMAAGLTINNLLSTASKRDTSQSLREDFQLPRVLNLSLRYPTGKNLDLLMSYKYYSVDHGKDNSAVTASGDDSGSFLYLGGEYKLDNPISARAGYMRDNEFYPSKDNETDQSLTMGVSYMTDKYNTSFSVLSRHDSFEKGNSLLVSYKGDQAKPWKTSMAPKTIVEIPVAPATVRKEPKTEYEEPLPAATKAPEKEKPAEIKKKPEENYQIVYDDDYEENPDVSKPPRSKTMVASFTVDPKVMIVPQATAGEAKHISGHWAEKYVNSLASRGFYSRDKLDAFAPSRNVPRDEFYRLVFISQVTRMFDSPVVVLFNTPYPVSAEMWLSAPTMKDPVLIQEGTYDRAGQKRLVINHDLLDEHEVFAGKYKLLLKLTGENMRPEELEEYITILDTSMDFSSLAGLPPDKKKPQVEALKRNMENMGMKVDYLDGLEQKGPITRLEALRSLLAAAGVTLPENFEKEDLFQDVWQLPQEDQAAVFLASRGMPSLGGFALMTGYPDNRFAPAGEVTGAEAAALIDRFRKLKPADFSPPYSVAIKPPAYSPLPQTGATQLDITVAEDGAGRQGLVSKLIQDIPVTMKNARYFITIGSYMSETNADYAAGILVNRGYQPEIFVERIGTMVARHVIVGKYGNEADARAALLKLKPVPEFDFRVVSISGGNTMAMTTSVTHQRQAPKPPARNSEGTMHLEGSSFVPWNLIRNLGDFDPHNAESPAVIIDY